tara:strand:+ start:216 stop:917 length:702 start_codon:yes stop_codon:yes gene_type:complete
MRSSGELLERDPPERLTEGIASGSGPWRTPNRRDYKGAADPEKRMAKGQQVHLNDQVKFPTPTANEDAAGTPDGKMQWMLTHAVKSGFPTRQQYEERKAGNASDVGSPSSEDASTIMENGSAQTAGSGHIPSTTISPKDASPAVPQMFPTPTSRDWKDGPGMSLTSTNPDGSVRRRDDLLPRRLFAQGCTGGQLNPDWVEWLMGWPIGWTSMEPLNRGRFRAWQRAFVTESIG